ncbi:hypothetical protein DCC62_23645 [candidate division KSB1 bacterium]|nr:MAG: hypothetical protein DCC62_23645 [candidate division KSB1 bacterium]
MASLFITKDDVGRAQENNIRLGDLSVSRQHARLRRDEEGHYLVEEVRSTNGIFLNENKLAAPTRLQEGDEIQVGAYVLRFAEELAATTDRLQALFAPAENTFIRKPEESTAAGILVNEANNAIFNLTQDRVVFGNAVARLDFPARRFVLHLQRNRRALCARQRHSHHECAIAVQ